MACSKCKKKDIKESLRESSELVPKGIIIFTIIWSLFALYGLYNLIRLII
jgi:hypothetical protein